jgi:predicted esterase
LEEIKAVIPAHKLEFDHKNFDREIEVFIKEPDAGVNADTGLFLILHAAGGYAENPYFRKLREEWADRYNVVAIGVNYLGTSNDREHPTKLSLQNPEQTVKYLDSRARAENPEGLAALHASGSCNWTDLLSLFPNTDLSQHVIVVDKSLPHRDEMKDYRDYGYIQTMDCLYAVKYTLDRYKINSKRIFVFGSSLGGYLAQTCAKFAPNTFSLVADNSGFPAIMQNDVFLKGRYTRIVIENKACLFCAPQLFYESDRNSPYYFSDDMFKIRALNDNSHLAVFKQHFKGRIVAFHAKKDQLVPYAGKLDLHEKYRKNGVNSVFYSFDTADIDGKVIISDGHGMSADLKLLFEKYCDEFALNDKKSDGVTDFDIGHKIVYSGAKSNFILDYSGGYPTIENRKIQRKK